MSKLRCPESSALASVLTVLISSLLIGVALLATGVGTVRADPGRIYVDAGAPGPLHDGTSWTTAYTNVQEALDGATRGDEIWVAEGVYYPDEGPGQTDNSQGSTFALKSGVVLYGGFDGTEDSLDDRDASAHPTILSGDIDQNDATDAGVVTNPGDIAGSNAYHVVTAIAVTETAGLDGFVVTAGSAYDNGGGMFIDNASPTVARVTFIGNAAERGGGMYNSASSPILTDVTFESNACGSPQASGWGGGMYNYGGQPDLNGVSFISNTVSEDGGAMYNSSSSPTLVDVLFEGNSANGGGAIYNINDSDPSLTHATFRGNWANNAGAMYSYNGCDPILVNVLISGNYAADSADYAGGAMSNMYSSNPTLINVTMSGNAGESGTGGIANTFSSAPSLVNCILWNRGDDLYTDGSSSADVTYSLLQGGHPGEGNTSADPLFVDPVPASAAPTTAGDYRLQRESSAVDAGSNAAVPLGITTDLDGNPRIVDGDGSGSEVVDKGAFEVLEWAPQPVGGFTAPHRLHQLVPLAITSVALLGLLLISAASVARRLTSSR